MNGRILFGFALAGLIGIAAVLWLATSGLRGSEAVEASAKLTTPTPKAQAAAPRAVPAPAKPPVDQAFVIKRILPIKGAIKYGEWHWDEAGVPAGPIVMTVDLDARVLSIFRGGYEIGAAAVLLGTEDKPTPLGVFPITEKDRSHVSNLYDAPMPYMMRLTNDGITLHGSKVEWGYASHGCVGMPEPFAAKVFAASKIGDRVFITRGKTVGMGDSLVSS
ncbi:lipoprotein-anchoring transpeptidase ErfK/SrfK [Novosphingobium chloroacetimidivorans]|uniref:Lipoprotein-anchoring transpeptidase ErfK/SrfK n=1 Tax=Novosphingobium chloroacetimidivorans TaxID=1428314 RepID=A0A7W7KCG1_9SPHN|nr:L,D-transpeptidase family protein [Novosphingobium chloroacetimidivorans]MBB4859518.1 lipoprotein-anchoring transpeptidase ErfK/SrfK [Novosphingobium chloroacetimidivorans]